MRNEDSLEHGQCGGDLPLHEVDMKEYSPSASDLKDHALSTTGNILNERSHASEKSKFKNTPTDGNLLPVDGGLHAWLFLLASCMLEAIVWGYAFSFGIFQEYYSSHEPLKGSDGIANIGTCAMGMAYFLAPLAVTVMILVPGYARWMSTMGVIIMCLSLALSSFASSVTHLILSQGIGFGVGGCLAYTPSILFMSEWFVKRKGFAFGIAWAGSGVSGVIFPLVIEWLLGQYGIKSTLRISAVALFVLAAPFLYFHRPRLPVSTTGSHHRLNFHFLYSKVFIIYQVGNTLEAVGFFLPMLYLPTYARSLGANDFMSSLTVILVNLATVLSSIMIGFLSDRFHITTCILLSTVGTAVSVFFIWGFAVTMPSLYVFCIAYGLLAGGFSATWSSISQEIAKKNPEADATVIFPFMEMGRGVGNVVSGPLSEALLKADTWRGHAWGTYGSGYGTLVVCTGATALIGGVSVVAQNLKWL